MSLTLNVNLTLFVAPCKRYNHPICDAQLEGCANFKTECDENILYLC
jgi:hypothetical protein